MRDDLSHDDEEERKLGGLQKKDGEGNETVSEKDEVTPSVLIW